MALLRVAPPRYPRTIMGWTTRLHKQALTMAARATCVITVFGVLAAAAVPRESSAAPGEDEPAIGEAAPSFELKDQSGAAISLADFKGKTHVLLAFYPKDFAPASANELKCFARRQSEFERMGVTVLAVSSDGPESHTRFAKSLGVRFSLLTDIELAVAKTYAVHAPSPTGGFAMRSVFLIDKEGVLRHVDRDFHVPKKLDGSALFDAVEALDGAGTDPFAELAELPPLERDGKTLLCRTILAVLAEDIDAVTALLHAKFRAMPGETPEAVAERRKAFLDLCRTTFEKHDLSGKKLSDVLRLRDAKVLDRDSATGSALKTFRSKIRTLAAGLAPGDVLVAVRGRGLYGEGGATILAREIAIVMRKEGETWMIAELSGR